MIIIFMHEYNGPQLIADMFLTFAYAIYIAHFRPYKDADSNKWALFNEFCGLLVRYFLFWLATFPDIDIEELDILKDIGWLYIGAVSLNIIVNFLKIGYNFLISLPSLYKQLSKKHDNYSLKEWQTNYLKKQREIMSLSLASKFERHAYYES